MARQKDTEDHQFEVCKRVLEALGNKPKNMFKITARNVFDNRWRVNIWSTKLVEGEYSSLTTNFIEYSYFIKFNNQLKSIITSDPEIESI
jgi:hypothetical protein